MENHIRKLAADYSNAYVVGIFASCRQVYVESDMTGCIPVDMVDSLKTESFDPLAQMSFTDSMTFIN